MDKQIVLMLPSTMVCQILDALHQRIYAWRVTEQFLRLGYAGDCDPIEECDNPEDAHSIGEYYKEIVTLVERQISIGP